MVLYIVAVLVCLHYLLDLQTPNEPYSVHLIGLRENSKTYQHSQESKNLFKNKTQDVEWSSIYE